MKRIVLTCLFIFLVLAGFTQDNRSDSLAIDSLKHQLAISKPDTNRVEVLAGLSFFYKFSNPDSAFFYGQQAIALASKIHYPKGEIDGLLWLGVANSALGNISKAMELSFKILKIADKNNLVIYKQSGLSLIGYYFKLSKNYSKALSYLYQALKISDPKRSSETAFVTMYALAYTYLDMNKLDSAAYYNQLASEIVNKYNLNVFRDRPYYIAGEIQYKKCNMQPAIHLLRQSLHYDSTGGDHSLIALIPYEIARIYQQNRQADSAIYYAGQSLEAAQRAKQYINIVQASKLLAELYEPRDLQKALTYNKTAIAAQDTIHYFENSSAVSSLSEYEEKERQFEIETMQTAYKNRTRQYALLGGLGVFLLIAFILYRNNKKQRKTNKLLIQQKKEIEKQRAEAQIEAALERVRSRSLAMHHSDELREVISLVLKNLQGLDIKMEKRAAIIFTFEEGSKGFTQWVASPEHANTIGLKTPYFDNLIFFDLWNARKKGINFYAKSYSTEVKNAAFNYLFKVHAEMGLLPEKEKDYLLKSEYYELSCAVEKNSAVCITNFSDRLLSSQEHEILKRFARVFEQAYIRFLDLQKAEARAREAKIEVALERIRSRSLAMHHSEELKEVISLVLKNLQELDIDMDKRTAIIFTFEEGSKGYTQWVAYPEHANAMGFKTPYFDNAILFDLWNARKKGIDFYAMSYSTEVKNAAFNYFFKVHAELGLLPEKEKDYLLKSEYYELSCAVEKNSAVGIANFSERLLSSKEHEILKRFARVFEQAYIRFLDLQKAEAQAREAQIQLALERVRARTMAMQRSEELAQTVELLFEEFQKLRILNMKEQGTIDRAVIGIINEPNHSFDFWINGLDGEQYNRNFSASLDEPLTVTKLYRAWKEGATSLVIDLQGEQLKQWVDYLKTIQVPIKPQYMRNRRVNTYAFFSKGSLSITTDEPIDKESVELLQRFAVTFDLTYTRFTDLQNAEARALIAVREASLDRVRAEIASMRHADDLQRITPLVWRELMVLNVPFFRCGLFIVEEAAQQIHFYLSTPDGKPLAALNLTFDAIGTIQEALAHWRVKKVYITHWTKEEFVSFAQSLMQQGQIDNQNSYQGGEEAPASLTLHFIPFAQGMLYIGSAEALSVNQIESVQALSDAFSTAYARYEDFIKLEAAKQQVENTLQELRSTQRQLVQSEKMASLGELTAGIAHEIQNPLNFVNNFSEVSTELVDEMNEEINKGNLEDAKEIAQDLKENLSKINYHGKRAGDIVKGMLQHSRSSSGQKEPTDINALADEYLRLAYHGLRAKDKSFNAKFETDFDPSIPKINIVPQEIGRVILNLINNAFYAVSEKKTLRQAKDDSYEPTVTVSTKKLKGFVEVKVQDNGNGIPQKVLDKIFQPFFTTKPTGQGTGLGLSLSFDIVKAHGGEIKVESKEGEGAAFIIQLPIVF